MVSGNPLYNDYINKIWLHIRNYPYIKTLLLYPNNQQTMAWKLNMVLTSSKVKNNFFKLNNKEENARHM